MELGGVGRPKVMPVRLAAAMPWERRKSAVALDLVSATRGLPAARACEMLEILEAIGAWIDLIAAEILTDCMMAVAESEQTHMV